MDLFSKKSRQQIPGIQYWELCDTYSHDSLQLVPFPKRGLMQSRLEELIDAETRLGFVYDAEKLWLQESLDSSAYEHYADWLLSKMNQHLFAQPLLWGVSSGGGEFSDPAENFWSADTSRVGSESFPFDITEDSDIGRFSVQFTLSVSGSRERPSPVHLVHAFRRLFNFPYHAMEIKHQLICRDKDKVQIEDYIGVEVENAYQETPSQWLLAFSNHYGSWEGIYFDDRHVIPYVAPPNPVRDAFESNCIPEWQPDKGVKYQHIPVRLVNKYRGQFAPDVVSDYVKGYGKYAYLCHSLVCQCGEKSEFFLQFKWGQVNKFAEYGVGDELEWGGVVMGYPEVEEVYVSASADRQCEGCKQRPSDTLICIKNNRVHSLAPEKLKNIEYDFQGPFVSDKLIDWQSYLIASIKNQWADLKNRVDIDAFDHCELPDFSDGNFSLFKGRVEYFYLISKHRYAIPFDLFVRSIEQQSFKVHKPTEKITLSSQLKTCAILHSQYNGKPCLLKFYWGSLLDFPEYKVGDTIQWSDYSAGDSKLDETVYARGFIDTDHEISVIIEIKHNRIIDIHYNRDKPDIDSITYNKSAYVFFGENWLPWMIMPDTEFIGSRRFSMIH